MRILATLSIGNLIQQYDALGVNIRRLVGKAEEIRLVEYESGLRLWEPLIIGDAQFYHELSQANPWYYDSTKKEYEVASAFLGGQAVLEIGCGNGYFAKWVTRQKYVGLELNDRAVKKAQMNGLDVFQKDFVEFAIDNNDKFDRVCSFQVLEHLESPESYFIASYKALTAGGLLITAVPSEDSFLGSKFTDCLNSPPHHVSRWTDNCLKQYPKQFGFELHDLIHLPIDQGHAERFIHAFVSQTLLRPGNISYGLIKRLQRRAALQLLRSLPKDTFIPHEFFIPGHTVLSVHRKLGDPI